MLPACRQISWNNSFRRGVNIRTLLLGLLQGGGICGLEQAFREGPQPCWLLCSKSYLVSQFHHFHWVWSQRAAVNSYEAGFVLLTTTMLNDFFSLFSSWWALSMPVMLSAFSQKKRTAVSICHQILWQWFYKIFPFSRIWLHEVWAFSVSLQLENERERKSGKRDGAVSYQPLFLLASQVASLPQLPSEDLKILSSF